MAAAPRTMSDEHKKALARGRRASRAVSAYLDALEAQAPRRGRRRTPDSIRIRLNAIDAEFDGASSLRRLQLAQERLDLRADLEDLESADNSDILAIEATFIEHAAFYAASKGISYAVWRESGVPARVLQAAGIRRGS